MKTKLLTKVILFFIPITTLASLPDLTRMQKNAATINGVSFPRSTDTYYTNSYDLEDSFKEFLDNNKKTLYSDFVKNIDLKLRKERIPNDIYGYMHDNGIIDEIDNSIRNYTKGDMSMALDITEKYLASFPASQFQSDFLDSDDELLQSVFIKLYMNKKISSRGDYYLTHITTDDELFDYSFYKNLTNEGEFIKISEIKDTFRYAFEERRSNGTIRVGFYKESYKGEDYIFVINGKGSKCITSPAPLKYVDCQTGDESKLIGIIKTCPRAGTPCSVSEEIWDQFSEFEDRYISSEYFEALDDNMIFDRPLLPVPGGSFPPSAHAIGPEYSELNQIASDDATYHGLKIRKIYTQYDSKTPLSVTFKFDDQNCHKADSDGEECLSPGEAIYIAIPEEFHDMTIADMTIAHRQNTNDNRGTDSFDGYTKIKDQYPAFIAAQAYSEDFSYRNAWRYWGGHTSGLNGGKYSEHKDNGSWEFDNLYEWPLHGHRSHNQKSNHSMLPLKTKYIRLFADEGKYHAIRDYDKAYLHSITISFVPEKADFYEEWSFTNRSTKFGDPVTMQGRQYGGGPKFRGTYPGAVSLSGRWGGGVDNTHRLDGTGWKTKWSSIYYELPVGKKLKSIEVAAGDTKPDGKPNKDGGIGSLGGAKLTVDLISDDGDEVIIDGANLGPKGITTGFPFDLDRTIKKGDKIIITSDDGRAYIMGVRIGYGD